MAAPKIKLLIGFWRNIVQASARKTPGSLERRLPVFLTVPPTSIFGLKTQFLEPRKFPIMIVDLIMMQKYTSKCIIRILE